jgi:hypothetical protein
MKIKTKTFPPMLSALKKNPKPPKNSKEEVD